MLRYLPLLLTSRTTRHLTTSTSVSLHPSLYLSSPRRSTSFPLSNRSSSTHPTRSRSLALSLPRIPTCARYTSVFLVYIAAEYRARADNLTRQCRTSLSSSHQISPCRDSVEARGLLHTDHESTTVLSQCRSDYPVGFELPNTRDACTDTRIQATTLATTTATTADTTRRPRARCIARMFCAVLSKKKLARSSLSSSVRTR